MMPTIDDDTAASEQTQHTAAGTAPIDPPLTADHREHVLGLLRERFGFSG
jgi:hypothetical protein